MLAVWFDMVKGDDRSRWPPGLFRDPRVAQFWDENRVLGAWFGGHSDYLGRDQVLWDTYLLYGPAARWEDQPSHLVSWGYTIMGTRETLRKDLSGLLGE